MEEIRHLLDNAEVCLGDCDMGNAAHAMAQIAIAKILVRISESLDAIAEAQGMPVSHGGANDQD